MQSPAPKMATDRMNEMNRRELLRKLALVSPAIAMPGALIQSALGQVASSSPQQSANDVSQIRFEEIAAKSGLHYVTATDNTVNKNQPQTMVAGVALFDYDNDGWLDVYLVGGASIPSLVKDSPAYWNRLFHNNHDGTFTDVTEKAGVAGAGYGSGVAVGDYDNDGHADLFLANVNGNQLFHNNGDGTFTDVTAKAGLSGAKLDGKKMWSVGAGWFDYNNDGLLDLFVVNYCKWEPNKDPVCIMNKGIRGFCNPNLYEPLHNTLYRNNGDGTFTDVSDEMGISKYMGKGMGVTFADLDGSGFLSAFVTNDTMPNFLFRNLHGRKFEEIGVMAGVAYSSDGVAFSGMGADFTDINNDGLPDIWFTAVAREEFPLEINTGDLQFEDRTMSSGLSKTTNMTGWGNGVFDFDNDGWKDLFVARANVMDNINEVDSTQRYPEPNTIYRNLGNGKFADISRMAGPDFQKEAAHRGVAFGDLDNDGRIDMVVSVLNGPAELFHNISETGNHWILLKLVGTKSNRMGIGAQIKLTAADGSMQWNEVTTAVGYASSSDSRVHFGLAKNKTIKEIEIRWPSGIRQVLRDLATDRILQIEEPKA